MLPSAKPGLPLKEQVPSRNPLPSTTTPLHPHPPAQRQNAATPGRLDVPSKAARRWPDNRPFAGVLGSRATFLIGGIIATLCSDGAQCFPCRYRSQNFSLATSEACLGYSSGTRHSGLPTQHTASGSLPRTRPRPGRLRLRRQRGSTRWLRQQTPQIRLLGSRKTAAGGQGLRGRMETDIRRKCNLTVLGSPPGSLCLCPCLSGPQCDTLELTQKIIIAPSEAMSGVLIIDPCKAPCLETHCTGELT